MVNPKIDIESAKRALLKSGYLLESRLESILREHNYYVEPNCLFTDPVSGKKREIDLIGYYYPKAHIEKRSSLHSIEASLIIECKNYVQPLAFIENDTRKDCDYFNDTTYESLAEVSGRPQKIIYDNYQENLEEFISGIKSLYYKDQITYASQYCTFFQNKQKEWFACHSPQDTNNNSENEHTLFEKILTYVGIEKREFWNQYAQAAYSNIYARVLYPVLVVQNDLWLISQKDDDVLSIQEASHIHYIRSHATGSKEKRYHIDVITEAYFPEYLSLINKQLNHFIDEINENFSSFEKGIAIHSRENILKKGVSFETHSQGTAI